MPPSWGSSRRGAPRASVDGPMSAVSGSRTAVCSPRERGWSLPAGRVPALRHVLPARAGMVRRCGRGRGTPRRCSPRERGWSLRGGRRVHRPRGAPRASGDGLRVAVAAWYASGRSPRERGRSPAAQGSGERGRVLPARAGMVPRHWCRPSLPCGAPRASGDGPQNGVPRDPGGQCSPREREWSHVGVLWGVLMTVLPARAGMVRLRTWRSRCGRGAPRASGDGPDHQGGYLTPPGCSPREQGWSLVTAAGDAGRLVLPARAGMVPTRLAVPGWRRCDSYASERDRQ